MNKNVLQWDRNDTESRHLSDYVLECIKEGKTPVITIMSRGTKIVGELIEMGTYVYVVDWIDGTHTRRTVIHKNSIDMVMMGDY